ncbi:hypothetical protein HJD18_15530 [Thermoleophilia bacterium SCSIO 60948]|nr:hypothetical protein HJD18_15530 [Thermoleophilia bacterium SCSIO 60948]
MTEAKPESKAAGKLAQLQEFVERERERYEERGLAFRVAWITAAVIVLLAGIAMMVFPGPAFIVIPVGLAMLSLQFAWAGWVLDTGLEKGQIAVDRVANASLRVKILIGAAVVTGAVCVGLLAYQVVLVK